MFFLTIFPVPMNVILSKRSDEEEVLKELLMAMLRGTSRRKKWRVVDDRRRLAIMVGMYFIFMC